MGDLRVNLLPFKEKLVFKSHYIRSKHRVPRKNKVDTYGTFAPDYGTTHLATKMCMNSNEYSV